MSDEELDLDSLTDDELVEQMHDDLYDGMADEIENGTRILLGRGWSPQRVLNEALVEGMRIVGVDFRDGILFVPEVLLAANAMKAGMAILRPLLVETGAESVGRVVIGTVKGDIHDIGKNLVGMMFEGAGFEVVDIGINNDAAAYLDALEEHQPDILGMSALLTTTMPYMKVVIDALVERGVRDRYIVMIGGAPVNEEFKVAVGADAYCRDAAVAAEMAKRLVLERRGLQAVPSGSPDRTTTRTGSRRGTGPRCTVLWWGEIPSQVMVSDGEDTRKAELPARFQEAIDRAAMGGGQAGSDAYATGWTRTERSCSADLAAELDVEVAELERRFDDGELDRLVRAQRALRRGSVAAARLEETAS
jgi:methanogenic corrinoid protein MtbC1